MSEQSKMRLVLATAIVAGVVLAAAAIATTVRSSDKSRYPGTAATGVPSIYAAGTPA